MKNPALTPEQARRLTYPRMMEVRDDDRMDLDPIYRLVEDYTEKGYVTRSGEAHWKNAAEPPAEIAEAMQKQFAWQPKRMLVWRDEERDAVERIVIHDLGEMAINGRYICVNESDEGNFANGKHYDWTYYNHAKPLPELDPITAEIEELTKRIEELKQQLKCK